jgi:hypothetical protein
MTKRHPYVRPSIPSDVEYLATNLAEEDMVEATEGGELDPRCALSFGLQVSDECYTAVTADGYPMAIFGVIREPAFDAGQVWMLSTPRVQENVFPVVRQGKQMLDSWLSRYKTLLFIMWEGAHQHRALCEHWGFRINTPTKAFGTLPKVVGVLGGVKER